MIPNFYNCQRARDLRNPDASSLSQPDINSNYGNLINVIAVDWGHWTGTLDSQIIRIHQLRLWLSSHSSSGRGARHSWIWGAQVLPDWVPCLIGLTRLQRHQCCRHILTNVASGKVRTIQKIQMWKSSQKGQPINADEGSNRKQCDQFRFLFGVKNILIWLVVRH